jgi:hypothetical protein
MPRPEFHAHAKPWAWHKRGFAATWGAAYNGFMTTEEIRRLHSKKPFEPFRLLVADGTHYDVQHPESLAMTGKGRLIAIGMRDHVVTLDLLLVTAVERPIPRRRGRNGAPKKRS